MSLLHDPIVTSCLLEHMVTYFNDFACLKEHRAVFSKEHTLTFSMVAGSIWYDFCFRQNIFTIKILNMLLPFWGRGGVTRRLWILTCHHKVVKVNIIRVTFVLFSFFSHFFAGKRSAVVVFDRFFFYLGDKKWSLVAFMGTSLGGLNNDRLMKVVVCAGLTVSMSHSARLYLLKNNYLLQAIKK